MTTQGRVSPQEMQLFYDQTQESGLVPGWLGRGDEAPPKPVPYLWRWSEVEPLVHRSGEVVTPDRDVERRILRLANPGLPYGTTHTITAAIQLLAARGVRPGPPAYPDRDPVGAGGRRSLHHCGRRQVLYGAGRPDLDPVLDLARPQQRGPVANGLVGRLGRAPGAKPGRVVLRAVPRRPTARNRSGRLANAVRFRVAAPCVGNPQHALFSRC